MNKFEYDVSVIVPVYNCEEFLEETLKSVISQTYPFEKIEIVLVNDGSKDGSLDICKNYSKQYSNIKVINKENAGVSAARNDGIEFCHGKYILILDGDDFLSKETISNLVKFFEKHYDEIDLLAYPLYNYTNGISRMIKKYLYYDKGTNVYDLEEYPHVNQTTVNIMLKNFDGLPRYDTSMTLAEDQKFNIECLSKKKKIGFCKEAAYYYRRHLTSVTSTKNHPLYCFDDIMSYNEYITNTFKENGRCLKFVQSNVLNTLSWRLRSDQLFPHNLNEKDFKIAFDRFLNILTNIDGSTIVDFPHLTNDIKAYLLKLKNDKINYTINKDYYSVSFEENILEKGNTILAKIHKFNCFNNSNMHILGYLDTTLFENTKPKMFIKYSSKDKLITQEIELFNSKHSILHNDVYLGNVYGFEINLDIKNIKLIEVFIEVNDIKFNIDFEFDKKRNNICSNKKFRLLCKNNTIKISHNNIFKKTLDTLLYNNFNFPIIITKLLSIFYITKKPIWLYSDSKGVVDNALYQFTHDIKKNDGIKRYYIAANPISFFKGKLDSIDKKHIIKYKSIKHKLLFLNASKLLTSFSNIDAYSPFGKSTPKYYDITKFELIYLQHGILHANLLKMYGKEFSFIDKIVISSEFEKQNLIENYNYKENDLIKVGMPRFGENTKIDIAKNKIIYAPSWRKYLIGNLINNTRESCDSRFIESTFYKEINNILNSKEMDKLLKDNNLTLDIKLHPIFKVYQKLFKFDSENIELNFENIKLDDYKIFITDFSSFQFDFVRLNRPIIYFVPDIQEFKAGLHTYRNLDLKYEDAFGKVCLTSDELISELKNIISKDCMTYSPYKERMETFFIQDLENCKTNLYNALLEDK